MLGCIDGRDTGCLEGRIEGSDDGCTDGWIHSLHDVSLTGVSVREKECESENERVVENETLAIKSEKARENNV